MIQVNTRDGATRSFNLEKPEHRRLWVQVQNNPEFQSQITAISLFRQKGRDGPSMTQTLTMPRFTLRVSFWAEVVRDREGKFAGERIGCVADDVTLSITLYKNQDGKRQWISRTDLHRVGRPRMLSGPPAPTVREVPDGGS